MYEPAKRLILVNESLGFVQNALDKDVFSPYWFSFSHEFIITEIKQFFQ